MMRIIVEIEKREDFNPHAFIDYLNDRLFKPNETHGYGYWATLIGIKDEDDETD